MQTLFQIYIYLCIICFVTSVQGIENNKYYQLRNQFLRLSLVKNSNNIYSSTLKEKIILKTNKIKHSILSKLYDINIEYTCLSDDDKYLLDTILGLVF